MRSIVACALFLLVLIGCKDKKDENAIDIIDTQMAELKKELPVPLNKTDSIELCNFWKYLKILFVKKDTHAIAACSLKKIYAPVYDDSSSYYSSYGVTELRSFLVSPTWIVYAAAFGKYLKSNDFNITVYKLDSAEIEIEQPTSNMYFIHLNTKQPNGHYTIHREHEFVFIKKKTGFKFAGVKVYEQGNIMDKDLISLDSIYFPLYRRTQSISVNNEALDTLSNKWYSAYLLEMSEPVLYPPKNNDEAFRFTWLRAFHRPIVIRLQKHNDGHTLVAKEMIKYGVYTPAQIKLDTLLELTATEWENIKQKVTAAGFWQMPSNDPQPPPNDGVEWILEVVLNNQYHFVERNMPADEDKKFRDACQYLLSLAKLNIPEKEIY